jgi:DNA replication protein DnaC
VNAGMSIYTDIKKEYDRRQLAAANSLQLKKSEVYEKIPRVEEIERQIQFTGIRYSKSILLGTDSAGEAITELAAIVTRLKAEKEALLEQFGYSRNCLEPDYQCPSCKDTGYIEVNNLTEKCVCYRQQLIDHFYSRSNLKHYENENFSAFSEEYYPNDINEGKYGIKKSPREHILGIKEKCHRFIDNFHSPEEKNLFFCGSTGVGKTFMANCIACELITRGKTVLYQTASVLFDVINQYKTRSFEDDGMEDAAYRNIFGVELLIIDDLGTESFSASRYAELLNILNTRQLNNLSKPCKTLISTNIQPEKLYEYYDERIASRIIGSFSLFRFVGEDIRSIKKMKTKIL